MPGDSSIFRGNTNIHTDYIWAEGKRGGPKSRTWSVQTRRCAADQFCRSAGREGSLEGEIAPLKKRQGKRPTSPAIKERWGQIVLVL